MSKPTPERRPDPPPPPPVPDFSFAADERESFAPLGLLITALLIGVCGVLLVYLISLVGVC